MFWGASADPTGRRSAERPLSQAWRDPAVRVEIGAFAAMALGTVVDVGRLGPLGLVELCGGGSLLLQLDAHRFGFLAMALAAPAFLMMQNGPAPGLAAALRVCAVRLAAMTLGMIAGAAAADALPGTLTFGLSFGGMLGGMAAGALSVQLLARGASRLRAGAPDLTQRG
jgi:hypothetical protein